MTGSVIIRCDASPGMGAGHVTRCLALADALRDEGQTAHFAVRGGTLETVPRLATSGHGILVLTGDTRDEASEIARWLRGPVDWMIVDHYQRDRSFEQACRAWTRQIAAIYDGPGRSHDADVLVDQTFGRRGSDYDRLLPPHATILAGARWAMLDPSFAKKRDEVLPSRAARPCLRVLVCMGGSDVHDVTSVALDGLAASGLDLDVDVVVGPTSPNRTALERRAAGAAGFSLHVGSTSMADLMAEADIAIGSGGVMSLERCCMGLPSLVVTTADNQATLAANLAAAGAQRLLGPWSSVTPAAMAEALGSWYRDRDGRARCAVTAASVCDGRGAARVADTLAAAARANGSLPAGDISR